MDLQHTFTVPIGIDAAWVAFTDLEGIAPCFPGAVITSVDGDDFTGTAKVKLGPIALMYAGKGEWVSRDDAAYRAVIEAVGKDKRGNGTASATITAHLESEGASLTKVVVDTDLRITGRPAQFGRGVIQDVGGKILDQFATCLSSRLGQEPEGGEDAAGAAPGAVVEAVPEPAVTEPAVPEPAVPEPAAPEAAADEDAADEDVAPTTPATEATPAAAPRPAPVRAPAPAEPLELDLGGVVGPVLLQRYGPTVLACAVTAALTWWLARRR